MTVVMPKIVRKYRGVVDHACARNRLRLTQARCCGTCAYCDSDAWCDHPAYRLPDSDESWLYVNKSWVCDLYEADEYAQAQGAPDIMLAHIKLTKTDVGWLEKMLNGHDDDRCYASHDETVVLREWVAEFPDKDTAVFALREANDGTRWCDITWYSPAGAYVCATDAYFEDYTGRHCDQNAIDCDLPVRHDVLITTPEERYELRRKV